MRHNRKITQELISSICDRILQGERIRAVAKAEAIGRSTFFYWLSRGESSRSGIYHQFFKQYHRAKTAYEARAIEKVIDATKERITEKALAAELGINAAHLAELEVARYERGDRILSRSCDSR